eukprot:COSAG02_NODE_14585_length_1257_cov_1.586356_1_plen_309_part_01
MAEQIVADPISPLTGGIAGFGKRLRRGDISAEQAAVAYLQRIKQHQPWLGAFQCVVHDEALRADARRIDTLLARGIDLGPLMGVPIAVKDIIQVDGLPLTAGSRIPSEVVTQIVGTSEGPLMQRIRRAGCIILGKVKTVEFAYGIDGINRSWGTPWNPHDRSLHRLPGGSSSGSAVATAAGLVGFAIGTDTGGSVRCPAALCGVVGLKTTYGRWELEGVFPLSPAFDTVGALAKTARDAAIVLDAISPSPVHRSLCCNCGRTADTNEIAFAEDDAVSAIMEAGAAGLRLGQVELHHQALWDDCEPVVLR